MTPFSSHQLAVAAAYAAESKKAQQVALLKTETITSLADFFVLCTAESTTQVRAISDAIRDTLKHQHHVLPLGEERDQSNQWHLLDYGDIIIHVMHHALREHYQLETFWSHAETVPRSRWDERLAS